jgi:putative transposase
MLKLICLNKTKKIKKLEKKIHRLQRKVSNKYIKNKKEESYGNKYAIY